MTPSLPPIQAQVAANPLVREARTMGIGRWQLVPGSHFSSMHIRGVSIVPSSQSS